MRQSSVGNKPKPPTQGVTLVELLVATAVMSMLSALVLQLYINQSTNHRQQQALMGLQQQALVAVEALRQAILEAGPFQQASVKRSVALASPVPGTRWQSLDHQRFDTLVLLADAGSDCSGSTLDSPPPRWKAFSVSGGELFCRDSDGQTLAIVSGVDAFQVRYGIDWHGIGAVNQYLPALAAKQAEHRVAAIRIGLVLKSDAAVLAAGQGLPGNVRILDKLLVDVVPEAIQGRSDRHLRRTVEMTFALRHSLAF